MARTVGNRTHRTRFWRPRRHLGTFARICLPWDTSLRGALRSASYRPPVYPAVARSAPLPSGAGSRAGREEVSPCPRHPRLSPQEASNCKIFSSPLKRNTRERGLQFYIWNISCPSDSRKGDHPFERPPPDFPLPLSRRRGTIFPAWRTWSISMPLPIAARCLVDAAKTFARTISAALPQWSRPFCQQHRSVLTHSIAFQRFCCCRGRVRTILPLPARPPPFFRYPYPFAVKAAPSKTA